MNLVGKSWICEIVWEKNQKEEIIYPVGGKTGRETASSAKKLGCPLYGLSGHTGLTGVALDVGAHRPRKSHRMLSLHHGAPFAGCLLNQREPSRAQGFSGFSVPGPSWGPNKCQLLFLPPLSLPAPASETLCTPCLRIPRGEPGPTG